MNVKYCEEKCCVVLQGQPTVGFSMIFPSLSPWPSGSCTLTLFPAYKAFKYGFITLPAFLHFYCYSSNFSRKYFFKVPK